MKLKRIKAHVSGNLVQVSGYAYASRGREQLIGSFACTRAELAYKLAQPNMRSSVGLTLVPKGPVPAPLDD